MSDTKTVILAIIDDVAPGCDLEGLDPAADLREELDIDSMDFLNVLIGIKERLQVEVAEQDYGEVRSLDGLVAYVDGRRSSGS
ncbi:MAG: acyl carrier protein [Myxococcales bacterium]|nr:acyl carrier protein [Myxococcales bacterium]MCB9713362.1 acyl carrier protein [Myxococcales bacterium]